MQRNLFWVNRKPRGIIFLRFFYIYKIVLLIYGQKLKLFLIEKETHIN